MLRYVMLCYAADCLIACCDPRGTRHTNPNQRPDGAMGCATSTPVDLQTVDGGMTAGLVLLTKCVSELATFDFLTVYKGGVCSA